VVKPSSRPLKQSFLKVKDDHRSKFTNLSNSGKQKPEKISGNNKRWNSEPIPIYLNSALNMRLCGINTEFVVFIPQSLVLRPIVSGLFFRDIAFSVHG